MLDLAEEYQPEAALDVHGVWFRGPGFSRAPDSPSRRSILTGTAALCSTRWTAPPKRAAC